MYCSPGVIPEQMQLTKVNRFFYDIVAVAKLVAVSILVTIDQAKNKE